MPHPRRPLDPLFHLTGGLLQAVRTSSLGFVGSAVDCGRRCGGGLVTTARHLGARRFADAGRSFAGALGRLAEGLVELPVAGTTHLLVDGFAGIAGGALFGSPLTDDERRFARSIFGDAVQLGHVRVVETGWHGRGMASAGTIFLGERDLADPVARAVLAHEMTHQYQDSSWLRPHRGTLRATWQAFQHNLRVKDVYKLDLPNMTDWRALEPESQAAAVECWVEYRAYSELDPCEKRDALGFYLRRRNVEPDDPEQVGRLERLLTAAKLFRGTDGDRTPRTWTW